MKIKIRELLPTVANLSEALDGAVLSILISINIHRPMNSL